MKKIGNEALGGSDVEMRGNEAIGGSDVEKRGNEDWRLRCGEERE